MGFAEGYSVGANAAINRQKLELAREEAAQNAKIKRQKLAQDRDLMNLQLIQQGYSRDDSGGFNVVKGGKADVAQQQRNLQMQEMAMQAESIRGLQGSLAAQATYSAIEEFVESGDADVFQRALNNNKFLKQTWDKRGVKLVSNVDFENDGKLLEAAGITKDYLNDANVREGLKKNIWKFYDGKQWNIGFLNQLVSETGALEKSSKKRSEIITDHMGRFRSAMKGVNVKLEDTKAATAAAAVKNDAAQIDVNAANVKNDEKRIQADIIKSEQEYEIDKKNADIKAQQVANDAAIGRGGTNTQKDMNAAQQETNNLVNAFGGVDAFFNTDFGDDKNYYKAYQHIAKIERYEKSQLSSADKKELNSIRQLIALSDPTKELSAEDTGFYDRFLGDVSKYLFNEVGGIKAKSAYAAFRNTVRHALFGSALTEAEITSFNEAFGTLGQKLGPVLQQFRTNLIQVKAKLESMRRNGNPYTMKVRLGVDHERLDSIISAFDARIEYITGSNNSKGSSKNYAIPQNSSSIPSLDELHGQYWSDT